MAIDAGSIYSSLELRADGYFNTLSRADKKANSFSTKMEKRGKQMEKIGSTLTKKVSLPIAGVATAAVKMAMDFETEMSKMSALSGAGGKDMEMLETKAREMGEATIFSASQAAEGMNNFALAGWNAEEMAAGIEPALLLAGAAGLELEESTSMVSNTIGQFGLDAEDATNVTNVLAKTQATAKTDVSELGEALKMAGVGAAAMGYDLESTSAMLGLFADKGLVGSKAGTAMNAMFRDLKKSAEDGAIAVGDSNIKIEDAEGNYRDYEDILRDVEVATKDMTVAERDAALMTIFGDQAMQGMNILMGEGSDVLSEYTGELRDSEDAARDMYDEMNDNLKGAWENLKSAMSEAALTIGEMLIPIIEKVVEWIQKWTEKFNDLDEGTKENIVQIGLLLMAIGPVISIISRVIGVGTKLHGGLGLVGKAMGLLSGPAGAIALVVGAGVLLYKNWDTVKEKAQDMREAVTERWDELKTNTKDKWDDIKKDTSKKWNDLKTDTVKKADKLKEDVTTKWENLKTNTREKWDDLKTDTVEKADKLKEDVTTKWDNLKTNTKDKWDEVKGEVSSKWKDIKTNTEKRAGEIYKEAGDKWEDIRKKSSTKWGEINTVISDKAGKVKNSVISSITESDSEWIKKTASIAKAASDKFGDVKKAVSDAMIDAKEKVADSISKIIEWNNQRMENKQATITTRIKQIFETVGEKVGSAVGRNAHGTDYWTGGKTWVGEQGPEIVELPKGSKVHSHEKSKLMVGESNKGITQNITINSPKSLNPSEIARKNLQISRRLAMEWGV